MTFKIFALFIFTPYHVRLLSLGENYIKSLYARAKTAEVTLSNHPKHAGEEREAKRS